MIPRPDRRQTSGITPESLLGRLEQAAEFTTKDAPALRQVRASQARSLRVEARCR